VQSYAIFINYTFYLNANITKKLETSSSHRELICCIRNLFFNADGRNVLLKLSEMNNTSQHNKLCEVLFIKT